MHVPGAEEDDNACSKFAKSAVGRENENEEPERFRHGRAMFETSTRTGNLFRAGLDGLSHWLIQFGLSRTRTCRLGR